MSYQRVIPRDLFNEASLLKCLGRLWIVLDNLHEVNHKAKLKQKDDFADFCTQQDPSDGSIFSENVKFYICGKFRHLYRPLNSRDAWPLWLNLDGREIEVFDDAGNPTNEFLKAIKYKK